MLVNAAMPPVMMNPSSTVWPLPAPMTTLCTRVVPPRKPLRVVARAAGSRWSRPVSTPANPPYTPTPSTSVKLRVRSVLPSGAGRYVPSFTHSSVIAPPEAAAVISASRRSLYAVAQVSPSPPEAA